MMGHETTVMVSVICAVFASTGFWAFLQYVLQRRHNKNTAESQMLKGLAHDRIMHLGKKYIKAGYISHDDYKNLHVYLYLPYKKLNGNGMVDKVMKSVDILPLTDKEEHDHEMV